MKNDLDAEIENLSNVSSPDNSAKGNVSKEIPVPSKPEMDTFYAKLSKSSSKPIALSLIPEYVSETVLDTNLRLDGTPEHRRTQIAVCPKTREREHLVGHQALCLRLYLALPQ